MLPRLRGTAIHTKKGWRWKIFVSILGSNEGYWIKNKVYFKTKALCIANMMIDIKSLCNHFQQEVDGKITGDYIDMKTNEKLNWNTKEHH